MYRITVQCCSMSADRRRMPRGFMPGRAVLLHINIQTAAARLSTTPSGRFRWPPSACRRPQRIDAGKEALCVRVAVLGANPIARWESPPHALRTAHLNARSIAHFITRFNTRLITRFITRSIALLIARFRSHFMSRSFAPTFALFVSLSIARFNTSSSARFMSLFIAPSNTPSGTVPG
jgi:hypothetical protein